ncbi:PadR family transcriptional regulator [Bailinhaonella thermotolerans]|nr:PadR family transcriptional regulator [Bailinhaonella thermotolerans]
MPEKKALNATAASLLGFLHDRPMSGWDLVETAQITIGQFWSLTPSQVYRELAAMAEDGLVERGEKGPRERQPYTITDAGRAAFEEWTTREPGPETIRYPLLLTLSFGRHIPPDLLAAHLRRHRDIHVTRLADLEALAGGDADPYTAATLDFGLAYERAVLDWFDTLPGRIPGL